MPAACANVAAPGVGGFMYSLDSRLGDEMGGVGALGAGAVVDSGAGAFGRVPLTGGLAYDGATLGGNGTLGLGRGSAVCALSLMRCAAMLNPLSVTPHERAFLRISGVMPLGPAFSISL